MWWILVVVLQAILIINGIRGEQRAGLWSWSKFAFTLAFAGLEVLLVILPIVFFRLDGPWFWPAFGAGWFIAALNFIWFIILARRWKLPDGRTSLQAYRDEHPKK